MREGGPILFTRPILLKAVYPCAHGSKPVLSHGQSVRLCSFVGGVVSAMAERLVFVIITRVALIKHFDIEPTEK